MDGHSIVPHGMEQPQYDLGVGFVCFVPSQSVGGDAEQPDAAKLKAEIVDKDHLGKGVCARIQELEKLGEAVTETQSKELEYKRSLHIRILDEVAEAKKTLKEINSAGLLYHVSKCFSCLR